MVAVPPVILVFDISALSVSSPSEWREFSRVGSCYVPQVVYEEMKLMFDRSPDPDLERISKSFNRFYASSGWKITDINAHHPSLKVGSGQALTRRARVSLAVGRCAYGLSQAFPNSLIILVSKDRSLLQRLYEVPVVNLCGITGESLLQWSRTGQRPIAVSQKFQQFRTAYNLSPISNAAKPAQPLNPPSRATTSSPARSDRSKLTKLRSVASMPDWLPDLMSLILAAAGLTIAGFLVWFILNNTDLKKSLPRAESPSATENAANPRILQRSTL